MIAQVLSNLRSQRGVAMVTVLLVAAALTATASAAAFVTIEEFGATDADRKAAQAMSYAEAGVDRMMLEIRKGNLTWNHISLAGCDADHPVIELQGSLGAGTYRTTLEVFDRDPASGLPADRFRPTACAQASTNPRGVHYFLITSTGQQPAARRVIRQAVDIQALGLPVGIYAYERVDANGAINLQNISVITEGTVTNRDNMGFRGTDPYYRLGDFYGSRVDATTGANQIPAAIHAKGAITYGAASKLNEHRTNFEPNCEANRSPPHGTAEQSLWDGSGTAVIGQLTQDCGGWPGSGYIGVNGVEGPIVTSTTLQPPTSRFTEEDRRSVAPSPTLSEQDYLTLREAAKANGLYCAGSTANSLSCLEGGVAALPAPTGGQITSDQLNHPNIPNNFVVFIDFPANGTDPFTRAVQWTGGTQIGPCNPDPANHRSAVWVVRNGSFDSSGGARITGAMLIPEGQFESSGNFTMEGTIIARRFVSKGTMTMRMSECWLQNLPGPFLDVTPAGWSEVDR